MNPGVDVVTFFGSQVAPEMQDPQSKRVMVNAACLKFVTVFRNQIPKDQIMAVFAQGICRHLLQDSAVLHSYAAICIDKLLSVRDTMQPGVRTPRYELRQWA